MFVKAEEVACHCVSVASPDMECVLTAHWCGLDCSSYNRVSRKCL